MDAHQLIRGAMRLMSVSGGWPSFSGGQVLRMCLDNEGMGDAPGPTLKMVVQLTDCGVDAGAKTDVLVHFGFCGVSDFRLSDFSARNILAALSVQETTDRERPDVRFEVLLQPKWGLEVTFRCCEIEVVDVASAAAG